MIPADLLRVRSPEARDKERVSPNEALKLKVLDWLCNGEVGISSQAIACTLAGIPNRNKWPFDHPSDPADFRRCFLLLKEIPELRRGLPHMARKSKVWALLIENWDTLESMLVDAMKRPDGRAPEMYALMKKLGC